MSLLRTSTSSLRNVAFRPAAMSVRSYADKPSGEFSEAYQRGSPQGFQKKEQAQENQYVQQQEAEKLKALRESISKQRQHLDEVERHISEIEKK